MLHPPGFYFVKKLKRFVILSSDKSSERNLSSFFDINKPRRVEHLQSEEPFSSDPYFSYLRICHFCQPLKGWVGNECFYSLFYISNLCTYLYFYKGISKTLSLLTVPKRMSWHRMNLFPVLCNSWINIYVPAQKNFYF